MALVAAPAPAKAGPLGRALGIPCIPLGEVRVCTGSILTLVPSWDGVPLDVDLYLPRDDGKPDPLIVGLHGFGVTKLGGFLENDEETPIQLQALAYAREGYAVMAYSARGIGFSCGLIIVRDLTNGCDRGWIHLADARYEARDTQHLAGLLVDEGLVKPRKIGVTGSSYGGGQSLLLATLRDRVMLPSGKLVPWKSPEGRPMQIAAAAPRIGWSDLAYGLLPTGRTLDFRARNPYGRRPGIVKFSYLTGLYAVAKTGYVAPQGADPNADLDTWKHALDRGEPYNLDGPLGTALRQLTRYHSPYYVLARRPREWKPPAPIVAYNAWTDDIMPPQEPLRYDALLRKRFPRARMGVILSAEFGHSRGELSAPPTLANDARDALFARYLMGDRTAKPLRGALTQTEGCGGQPELGPFRTRSWHAQHPGEVRLRGAAAQTITSAGGSLATSLLTDPFLGGECPGVGGGDDPGAASYRTRPAGAGGFTLMGSPTVTADLEITGRFPQVVARLWDVAPNGSQTMVQHSPYRPGRGVQTFQLQPSGWHFAPGHAAKLELVGRDFPYVQASKGTFSIEIRDLRLDLPVRERPDGDRIKPYRPPET